MGIFFRAEGRKLFVSEIYFSLPLPTLPTVTVPTHRGSNRNSCNADETSGLAGVIFLEITCTVEMPHLKLNTENHAWLQATLPTGHACYRIASQLVTHVQLETRGWSGRVALILG